jgi:GDP-D-mannose dehydratase
MGNATAKRALIAGVTGQGGAYLAEFLFDRGYEVHCIKQRISPFDTKWADHRYREQPMRFYQASTYGMYGLVKEASQCESEPVHPRHDCRVKKLNE